MQQKGGVKTAFGKLACGALIFSALTAVSFAQDPIRVETRQVLVPVAVADKNRIAQLHQKSLKISVQEYRRLVNDAFVRDLAASDFHLFEDGAEQKIQNVTLEEALGGDVRDSAGIHAERIGEGGGRWSSPDRLSASDFTVATPHYLVSYSPPESPEGSCHQIKVTVDRAAALVEARSQYCNLQHAASDVLKGTKFGKELESDLESSASGKLKLTLEGVAFHQRADGARVYVAIEFPWQALKYEWNNKTLHATIGVLGMIYRTDGTLAVRFSDTGCCDVQLPELNYRFKLLNLPTRYETQVDLPRGKYNLLVALGDGAEFGVARMPLTVNAYDREQLAISDVAICRRIREASPATGEAAAKLRQNYAPLVSNGYEVTPTADTRLQRGEGLRVYFEIYKPELEGQPPTTVEAHLRIVDLQAVQQKAAQTVSVAPFFQAGSPVISIGREIDISKLPDGSYRLEVEASDSAGRTTGWRGTNFTVQTVEQIRLR